MYDRAFISRGNVGNLELSKCSLWTYFVPKICSLVLADDFGIWISQYFTIYTVNIADKNNYYKNKHEAFHSVNSECDKGTEKIDTN